MSPYRTRSIRSSIVPTLASASAKAGPPSRSAIAASSSSFSGQDFNTILAQTYIQTKHLPIILRLEKTSSRSHKPSEMPAMFCLPKDDLILEDAPSGNNSARYRLYAVVHQGLLGCECIL